VLRFQTPLIEPDGRISRIRLSEKASRRRTREVTRPPLEADQPQHLVQVHVRVAAPAVTLVRVLRAQPLTQPSPGLLVHRRFLRSPSTKAPSLHPRYGASSVLRAFPSPDAARRRPSRVSGRPSRAAAATGFPCLRWLPLSGLPPPLPRQDHAGQVAHRPARHRPSPRHRRVGPCVESFEACSAFTRVAAGLLAESPGDPFHRRLRRLRCLRRRSDCCRLERHELPGGFRTR